jgi:Cu(I)/Ag(I) efflux system protein CusF
MIFAGHALAGAALMVAAGMAQGMDHTAHGAAEPSKAAAVKAAPSYAAVGVVRKIDAAAGKVTIDHEPIQSLYWPAMTMDFAVIDKSLLEKLGVGKRVNFELAKQGTQYVITSVK